MSDARIRIRRVGGQWYAFASGGDRRSRNLMLVSAINYCRRLNAASQTNKKESHG